MIMPEQYDKCVEDGGKITKIKGPSKKHGLKKGESVNFCVLDGKSYKGYVQKKKTSHYRED
jgi:hypothetical protein